MEKLVKQILGQFGPARWKWPKNWVLKLASLFFAIFLWYFVVGEDKVDMIVSVPIEIINLPRGLVISNQFKKQLEVTVTGPSGLTKRLANQYIRRPVDLSKATPGTMVVNHKPEDITFPRGINVLRIQPTNISLRIDRLIEKELAIKPTLVGKLPKGFELASTVLEPATITFTAPEAVIKDEIFLVTEDIDLSGITENTKKQVTLALKPAIADLLGESVVTANIIIKEKQVEKLIPAVDIEIIHSAPRTTYRIQPPTVTISAELPYTTAQKHTDNLKTIFAPKINADNLPPGTYKLKVEVKPIGPNKVLEVKPEFVHVKISKSEPAKKRKPLNNSLPEETSTNQQNGQGNQAE
ncbi:MAG: YbbR-like domain-containing protein [Proteobacteria bacterium]|nr:YbbR-like domain-containing protein [Pseudomonadota bacterium]MBU1717169.1 YbbR-like domain-containing protein [Pseudomonadota bacterium]